MSDNPYADLESKYANNLQQQNEMLAQQSAIQKEQSQANTNQVLNEINQQKEYANKDFNKEARGAYQDYQKLVNPYGVQAEQNASNGLGNSGYSETSRLNAYNTYQNRYAVARESTDRLQQDFNNQITQARLSGNKELAEIALNELQTKMTNMWNQLNLDTSLAQSKVNYNQWLEEFNYNKKQDEIANAFAREQFEYQKQQDALNRALSSARSSSSGRSYSSGSGSSSSSNNANFTDSSNNSYSKTVSSVPKTAEQIAKDAVALQIARNAQNNLNPLTGIGISDAVKFNKANGFW